MMHQRLTCPNCAALRERVHELERELGLRMQKNGVMRLIGELKLRPMPARAVMLLYQAKGRYIDSDTLMETCGFNTLFNMRAVFWQTRKQMGDDFIESAWGKGYRLGRDAIEKVSKALEQ